MLFAVLFRAMRLPNSRPIHVFTTLYMFLQRWRTIQSDKFRDRSPHEYLPVALEAALGGQLGHGVRLDEGDEPALGRLVHPALPRLAQVLHKLGEREPLGGVHVDVVPTRIACKRSNQLATITQQS